VELVPFPVLPKSGTFSAAFGTVPFPNPLELEFFPAYEGSLLSIEFKLNNQQIIPRPSHRLLVTFVDGNSPDEPFTK